MSVAVCDSSGLERNICLTMRVVREKVAERKSRMENEYRLGNNVIYKPMAVF